MTTARLTVSVANLAGVPPWARRPVDVDPDAPPPSFATVTPDPWRDPNEPPPRPEDLPF